MQTLDCLRVRSQDRGQVRYTRKTIHFLIEKVSVKFTTSSAESNLVRLTQYQTFQTSLSTQRTHLINWESHHLQKAQWEGDPHNILLQEIILTRSIRTSAIKSSSKAQNNEVALPRSILPEIDLPTEVLLIVMNSVQVNHHLHSSKAISNLKNLKPLPKH